MQEISWSTADARRLKKLRLEAGHDLVQFSKLSAVSVAQISQLEESGNSLFYSERIKYSVGKRLTLLLLKGQNARENGMPLVDEKTRNSHVSSHSEIKAIAEMSRRNLDARPIRDFFNIFAYRLGRLVLSKYVMSSIGMVLLMLGVWFYERHTEDDVLTSELNAQPKPKHEVLASLSSNWLVHWLSPSAPEHPKSAPESSQVVKKTLVTTNPADKVLAPSDQLGRELLNPQASSSNSVMASNSPEINPSSVLSGTSLSPIITENAKTPVDRAIECVFTAEGPEIVPTMAYKPSNYVYVEALSDAVICLEDSQKKIHRLSLQAGAAQSVMGSSPWKLSLKAAQQVRVFFQGQRMQLPDANNQTITLMEYRP